MLFILKKKEQLNAALTYECSEQSTADLQKLSVFHTTVTYATAKIRINFNKQILLKNIVNQNNIRGQTLYNYDILSADLSFSYYSICYFYNY